MMNTKLFKVGGLGRAGALEKEMNGLEKDLD